MAMRSNDKNFLTRGFSTPPPTWRTNRQAPVMPRSERKWKSPQGDAVDHLFHIIHKVPAGDSPYVRAKHVQLVDKDPNRAVSMFWAAINAGDRVDSALKDMAVVMKQLNRPDEAIEAIKSFRHLCPLESQESLDNVLVELYKRSGRIEEQIEMLQAKLKHIEQGIAFGGRRTKPARSQGKKVQITIEQEYSRLLGNLAWAYLQQNDYKSAEELYRKGLSLEQDKNKQCNLAICLMYMNKMSEAKFLLEVIRSSENGQMDESYAKSFDRATQILAEFESQGSEGNRIPFSSFISRNSEEFPIFHKESQNHNSGFTVSRKLADGPDKEISNDDDNFFGSDKEKSNCASFGPMNGSMPTCRNFCVEREFYTESFYKRRAGFGGKREDNWAGVPGAAAGYANMKGYASPFPAGGSPKIPFTQPKRGPYSFANRVSERAWVLEDGAATGCNRKLSFADIEERERKDGENLNSKAYSVPAGSVEAVGHNREGETSFYEDYDHGSEPLTFAQTPRTSKYFDENRNCNIIFGSLVPENLCQKIESFGLKDGYYSQRGNADISMTCEVRGSFFFDQHQKPDGEAKCCSSPLLKNELHFHSYNSVAGSGSECTSGNGTNLARRNRLQVFKDITHCESPRP